MKHFKTTLALFLLIQAGFVASAFADPIVREVVDTAGNVYTYEAIGFSYDAVTTYYDIFAKQGAADSSSPFFPVFLPAMDPTSYDLPPEFWDDMIKFCAEEDSPTASAYPFSLFVDADASGYLWGATATDAIDFTASHAGDLPDYVVQGGYVSFKILCYEDNF